MIDSLGDRMKLYEAASATTLPGRMPVIIRVDGRAFHSYTRGCKKPFDASLQEVMNAAAVALCEEIQGAQMAYVQSDEISVLVHGYKRFNSVPWFANQVQKMTSLAAAIASTAFTMESWKIWMTQVPEKNVDRLFFCKPATFDARAFVVPEADVCNYFIWRQQDATRNSVSMLARSYLSHAQCDGKTISELRSTLLKSFNVDWAQLPVHDQRGRTIVRQEYDLEVDGVMVTRSQWNLDVTVPIFSQERSYVEDLLEVDEK
jgi:tRNA(His) 5'-end guanylyltransferase